MVNNGISENYTNKFNSTKHWRSTPCDSIVGCTAAPKLQFSDSRTSSPSTSPKLGDGTELDTWFWIYIMFPGFDSKSPLAHAPEH